MAIVRAADGTFRRSGGGGGRSSARAVVVRVPGAVKTAARRGASAVARAAIDERHTLVALGAAGALGLLEKQDVELPHFEPIGVAGTYGIAAFMLARFTKSRTLAHAATGLMSIAVYNFAKGDDDATSGGGGGRRRRRRREAPVMGSLDDEG